MCALIPGKRPLQQSPSPALPAPAQIKQLCDEMGDRAESALELKMLGEMSDATERILGGLHQDTLHSPSGEGGSEGERGSTTLSSSPTLGTSDGSEIRFRQEGEAAAAATGAAAMGSMKRLKNAPRGATKGS